MPQTIRVDKASRDGADTAIDCARETRRRWVVPPSSRVQTAWAVFPGRPLRLLCLLAVGCGAVVLGVRSEDGVTSFGATFAQVEWRWLGVAVGLNLVSAGAGSLAWWTVITEAMKAPRPVYRDVFSAFAVGLLANAILPGRAGELARVAVLARRLRERAGIWATLVGTVVAYRLLDLIPSLALAGFVLFTVSLPHWAISSLVVVAAVGSGAFVLAVVAARRHERPLLAGAGRLRRLFDLGRYGLGVLRSPLPAVIATVHQCVAWSAQLLAVWVTLRAFHIAVPLSVAALVLVLVNLAIAFPLWPGNVGVLQAAIAVPLARHGVAYSHGLALGVGLQATETAVGVSLGLACLAREGLSVTTLRQVPTVVVEPS